MPRQIFPSSIVEFSEESLIQKHSTQSKTIYWLLILMVLLFGVSIFFVKVDVNLHARGIVTSQEQSTSIASPVSGTIQRLYLAENAFVRQGDTLLVVETQTLETSISSIKDKKELIENSNSDLRFLSGLIPKNVLQKKALITPLYSHQWQEFKSILRLQKSEIAILKKEYNRQEKLYAQKVIAKAEYETVTYKLENERLQYQKIFDSQLSRWQKQLEQNKTEIIELDQQLNSLAKDLGNYFIKAPISGYIQKLSGIKKQGLLSLNQDICIISPSEHLMVETYVSSSDIGLVRMHQEVKFRVDAFNFNQWGMLKGKVVEIANDIRVQDNGTPYFKIRCQLESTSLSYQGRRVNVKKGMAINANFFLSERTLAQLLYDKITDWMDPNVMGN